MPIDDKVEDHSYDYAATQVIAEYLRSKNYNGICFKATPKLIQWKTAEMRGNKPFP